MQQRSLLQHQLFACIWVLFLLRTIVSIDSETDGSISSLNYFPEFPHSTFLNLKTAKCNEEVVAGPYVNGEKLATILLPPKNTTYLQVNFTLYLIDEWIPSQNFQLFFDDLLIDNMTEADALATFHHEEVNLPDCGESVLPDNRVMFHTRILPKQRDTQTTHRPSSFVMQLKAAEGEEASGSWAVRNLAISFITCPTGCNDCNALNPSYCTVCKENYYKLTNEQETTSVCTQNCPERLGPADGICEDCSDSHCIDCQNSITQCKTCEDGFYITEQGECTKLCPKGSYAEENAGKCVNTCSEFMFMNITSRKCEACIRPKVVDTLGQCTFCGANCKRCGQDSTCMECIEGFVNLDGVCQQPSYTTNITDEQQHLITQLAIDQPGSQATQQVIILKYSSQVSIQWYLLASNIIPERSQKPCKQLAEEVPNDISPQIYRQGTRELEKGEKEPPYDIIRVGQLRSDTTYNFVACASEHGSNRTENLSITFQTKSNGRTIERINFYFSKDVDSTGQNELLCDITALTGYSASRISTMNGKVCLLKRNLQQLEDNHQKQTVSTRMMPILIYGNSEVEEDASASEAVQRVTNRSFWTNFDYQDKQGEVIKIIKAVSEGKIMQTVPRISDNAMIERLGAELYISDLFITGNDGLVYAYLEKNESFPGLSGKKLWTSIDIIQNYQDYGEQPSRLICTHSIHHQRLTLKFDGLLNDSEYSLKIFATTEDPSIYSLKSPQLIYRLPALLHTSKAQSPHSALYLIIAELTALLMLVVIWCWLFKWQKGKAQLEKGLDPATVKQRALEYYGKSLFALPKSEIPLSQVSEQNKSIKEATPKRKWLSKKKASTQASISDLSSKDNQLENNANTLMKKNQGYSIAPQASNSTMPQKQDIHNESCHSIEIHMEEDRRKALSTVL